MKLLLKTLLQRRARDEGFTLPIVIALGLVMLLLGAVNITIANEENLTAISQNSRSDALAIAEVGIARYRELLDRNRILTIYDSRLPTTTELDADPSIDTELWGDITEVCDDNITSFVQGTSNPIILNEDGQILNNDGDSTDTFNIGSYSLVSYDYINDNDVDDDSTTPGIANGAFNMTDDTVNDNTRGILTVKGTAPDGSEAQIEVEIPIRINLADMTNLAPALWIGDYDSTTTNLGNLTIGNGNVVIKDQASADGCNGFSTLASTSPRRPVISDSRDLPPITQINADIASARTAHSITVGNPINAIPTGSEEIVFGSTTDKPFNPDSNTTSCPQINLCRYYYDPPATGGLTYTNKDLLTEGIANTTLLLNEALTISATTDNVKVGSTSTISNSNAFEIYVDGNNDITINADSGRTVTINGFIHAPQSTLTITGSGTVNINGSVWVNDFVNTTATVNISPDTISRQPTLDNPAVSGQGYEFYSTTVERTPRPLTGSPTNWKTEQIN